MTPDKKRKLIVASTATMVLLLFILIAVMIYQMVSINGKKAKIEQLKQQIEQLKEEQEELTDDIDVWISKWKIEERARELKYVYPEDKTNND